MSRFSWLALAVAVGACVRMAAVVAVNPGLRFPDEERFWVGATNFAASGSMAYGAKMAHDMPLSAVVMGSAVRFLDLGLVELKLLMAAVAGLLPIPTAHLAAAVAGEEASETAGPAFALAALAAALHPFAVFFGAALLSESLFLLLTTTFFWLAVRHEARPPATAGNALASGGLQGLVAGLANLTRPTIMYFVPLLVLVRLVRRRFSATAMAAALCLVAVFCLAMAPWVARNYAVFGRFVPATANSGQVLWEGNNPWNETGGVAKEAWKRDYLAAMPEGLGEFEADAWKKQQAIDYIKEDPAAFLDRAVNRFFLFWNPGLNDPGFDRGPYRLAALAASAPLMALSLAAAWVLRRRWRVMWPLWLFGGYYTLLHMVTIGSVRYRLPLEPLMMALAAACLARLLWPGKSTAEHGMPGGEGASDA